MPWEGLPCFYCASAPTGHRAPLSPSQSEEPEPWGPRSRPAACSSSGGEGVPSPPDEGLTYVAVLDSVAGGHRHVVCPAVSWQVPAPQGSSAQDLTPPREKLIAEKLAARHGAQPPRPQGRGMRVPQAQEAECESARF